VQRGLPQKSPKCPECGSQRVWKDGLRYTGEGLTQRWLCQNCGYRFSNPTKTSKTNRRITEDCRVCVPGSTPGSKNTAKAVQALKELERELAAGTREPTKTNVKSLLFNFAWWMKKQGFAESTIESRVKLLKILAKRGADLQDPESVKEVIAKQSWSEGRKVNAVDTYTSYLQMLGKSWNPPRYRRVRKLPFIPLEKEIDDLIAGCGPKTATFLQLLKETGMRAGEA